MKSKILSTAVLVAAGASLNGQVSSPITVVDENLANVNSLGGGQFLITDDLTFDGVVVLEGTTFVAPGATLTITAGTIVRGQPAAAAGDVPGSLVVSRGAQIDAVGTVTNPIIFTTAADTNRERWQDGDSFLDADPANSPVPPISVVDGASVGNAGLWGAVTLLGYAPTNRGNADTGISGEAYIEGFGIESESTTYGGFLPNDSSGVLEYVSIRHSGATIVEGDEQQGLTLGGVGAGTRIENIDIYCSADDGIEIFGGTANLRNVIISYVNDDGLDLDQGWTGNAQFVFVLASNLDSSVGIITTGSVAEWDGEDGASSGNEFDATGRITSTGQPFTAPTMYNITMFAEGSGTAVTIDTNFGGNLFNSVFFGLDANDIRITDNGNPNPGIEGFGFDSVGDRLIQGSFNVNSVHFIAQAGVDTTTVADGPLATGVLTNDETVALNSESNVLTDGNPFFYGAAAGGLFNDQSAQNGVNPVPLTGANRDLTPVVGPFFEAAPFRGAFPQSGTSALFTTGWTALNIRGILVDAGNGTNIL